LICRGVLGQPRGPLGVMYGRVRRETGGR
jgi:hypothetical protein